MLWPIAHAFEGADLEVLPKDDGYFDIQLSQYGLLRPLKVAALLSPDAPSLMVLNEPETSLHPDLLAPLSRLVVTTARKMQLIIVAHAPALVDSLANEAEVAMFALSKHLGETVVSGSARPSWQWPSRT